MKDRPGERQILAESQVATVDCWAGILGGCDGGLSREHVISDALLEGDSVTLKGFRWCREIPRTVGKSSAVARILCVRHNNLLSECDSAAKYLKAAMKSVFVDSGRKASKPVEVAVQARAFSRWICKTACNAFAVDERAIDPDLVRYAFGQKHANSYHTYIRIYPGRRVRADYDHIEFEDLNAYDGSGALILRLGFYGLEWWFTNYDVKKDEYVSVGPKSIFWTGDLLENVRALNVGASATLKFLWR